MSFDREKILWVEELISFYKIKIKLLYSVRHRESCKVFALKMVRKSHLSDFKRLEQLLRERKILIEAAENNFVARLHACFESDAHLNFLLEFYPGGELFYHL